jgi:hypothetical protein
MKRDFHGLSGDLFMIAVNYKTPHFTRL